MKKLTVLFTILSVITLGSFAEIKTIEAAPIAEQARPKVTFTFDDGFLSTYRYARPILASYGYSGTAYITTDYIGTDNFMTWSQVESLATDYGWEIGAHTVTHPILEDLSEEQIQYELLESKEVLANHGINAKQFASPYGSYDGRVLEQVANLYQSHRGFKEQSVQNRYPTDQYNIWLKAAEKDVSVDEIKSWIDQSIQDNTWLVISYHDLDHREYDGYPYATLIKEFKEVVSYVNQKGVEVVSLEQGLYIATEGQISSQSFHSTDLQGWIIDGDNNVFLADMQFPYIENQGSSLMIQPLLDQNTHIFSPTFLVSNGDEYLLSSYINNRELAEGEVGFYVDEYDGSGNWISGQWLGAYYSNKVSFKREVYTPSSNEVVSARFQLYVTPASDSVVWVDEITIETLSKQEVVQDDLIAGLEWVQVKDGVETVMNPLSILNESGVQHIFSPRLSINTTQSYRWLQYIESSYEGGEVGWYIDEYDVNGNWISGQWKGVMSANFTGWQTIDYSPTSDQVVEIRLQYYVDDGTSVTNLSISPNRFFK